LKPIKLGPQLVAIEPLSSNKTIRHPPEEANQSWQIFKNTILALLL